MSVDESIDELIDKIINEDKISDDEIKKRKSKPFRYLTDDNEIHAELSDEKSIPETIMKSTEEIEVFDYKLAIVGLGDIEIIENVIRKHEASRKFKDK